MTINNEDYYMGSIWDWGLLDDCFGTTKIKVSDVDGIVERKGKFIFIECKSHNAPITQGQAIMHNSLIKTGVFTVLLIWGDANKPTKMKAMGKNWNKEFSIATLDDIHSFVERWFAYVDNKKPILPTKFVSPRTAQRS
jgi:hypothetical protein